MSEVKEKSLAQLVEEAVESIRASGVENPVLYDLGSGPEPAAGFVGLDLYASGDRVLSADLFGERWLVEGKIIPDSSVDMLYSSHFVEHVPDWDAFFTEAYRVLKPGGIFIATTPYYSSVRATQDPDHKQFVSEERYCYLNAAARQQMGVGHYSADVDFEIEGFLLDWHRDFKHVSEEAREYAKRHYINAVNDIVAILRAKKT